MANVVKYALVRTVAEILNTEYPCFAHCMKVACLWQNCVGGVTQLNTSQQRPRPDGKDHEVLATFSCPCQLYSENQLKCCNFKLIFNGTFFAVFGTKLLFPSHVKSKIAFSADNYNSSSTSFSLDVLLRATVNLILLYNNHDRTFEGVN